LVSGQGIERLKKNGIVVETGILEEEAKKLNEVYIKYITTGRPFVLLKGAMSLDGKIATRTGHSSWITGERARLKVHELRNEYDGILVGIGTVLADDPQLTSRLPNYDNRDPIRIILDSQCRIPLTARVLNQKSKAETIVVVSPQASKDKLEKIKELGARILVVPERDGLLDLEVLIDELGKMQITSLMVEGGARVNGSFLAKGLVDKIYLFLAPKIIGGNNSLSLIEGWGVDRVEQSIKLKELSVEIFGDDLGIIGYPV
jgi:diaminohydroxyphosphoribosylaminopyrimidine deaminase/5-amino-6-(5-phosphoribosylamino)uracil reductase